MRIAKSIFLIACIECSVAHAQGNKADNEGPLPLQESAEPEAQAHAESKSSVRRLEWNDADCEPGARALPREGEADVRLFCRPRSPLRVVVGVSMRGVRSEGGSFSDTIGFEAAGRFLSRFDLGVGVGRVFREGVRATVDVHSRLFLFDLPSTGGPYLGGGIVVSKEQRGFVTFGFFGGSGLFFEVQFRGSTKQPIAVIPAFGLRAAFL